MRGAGKLAKDILPKSWESDWDIDLREKREGRRWAESTRFSVDRGL